MNRLEDFGRTPEKNETPEVLINTTILLKDLELKSRYIQLIFDQLFPTETILDEYMNFISKQKQEVEKIGTDTSIAFLNQYHTEEQLQKLFAAICESSNYERIADSITKANECIRILNSEITRQFLTLGPNDTAQIIQLQTEARQKLEPFETIFKKAQIIRAIWFRLDLKNIGSPKKDFKPSET